MQPHQIFLYIVILMVIVYCPGPMTLFCLATSMQIGPKATFPALLGGTSAYISQLIIVFLGLGLLLHYSIDILDFVKWLGAAYLIYLGIRQWRATDLKVEDTSQVNQYTKGKMYLRGFFVGITNPKSIIVFLALFPHFISAEAPYWPQLLILSFLFLVIQFSGAFSYTFFGGKIFKWLQRKKKERLLRGIVGAVLVAAGILLASMKQ